MIDPGDVVAVVLAAGLSRRFGSADKLMATYRDAPLISHVARLVEQFPFKARLAVVREGSEVSAMLGARGFETLTNRDPENGLGGSLAIGVRAAIKFDPNACLVLLGDTPNVTSSHIHSVLAAFSSTTDIVVSGDNQRRSPPTLFGRRHLPELTRRSGDHGAADLTGGATIVVAESGILTDIDSADDLRVAADVSVR